MGAGASASDADPPGRCTGQRHATQEQIDAYIAENNLNTAQRPAQDAAEPAVR